MEILIRSVLHVIQAVALVMTVEKLGTFLIAFNVVQTIHLDLVKLIFVSNNVHLDNFKAQMLLVVCVNLPV